MKNNTDYFEKLHDALGDAVITVKLPEGKIENVNHAVKTVFGYTSDECIGKSTAIFYPPEGGFLDVGRKLQTRIEQGKPILKTEQLLRRKNGEVFPSEITITFMKENSKIARVISIVRDVTDLKKSVDELIESKQQMHLFSLATSNMLWNWNLMDNSVERSIGFETAFGYSKLEIAPTIEWWMERLHPDDQERVMSLFNKAIGKGETKCSYEYRFRCRNARYAIISDQAYILRNKEGKAIRALGAMTDITIRKQAEKMLLKQNKALEQKNIALREVLSHIELEKKEIKDYVITNTENLLLPIIEKIKLNGKSLKHLNILRKCLKNLTSSFGVKVTKKETKLTSREIEVCNMIKSGLKSKEIADLLNISLRTIEKHRSHIRKKLGITNKETNLTTFLKAL